MLASDALSVLFGLDKFWKLVGFKPPRQRNRFWMDVEPPVDFSRLDMLSRVSKSMRVNIDFAFAIKHMASERGGKIVGKMWARRWVGLREPWLAKVNPKELSLLRAFEISRERGGGFLATVPFGFEFQAKEQERRQQKEQRVLEEQEIERDVRAAFVRETNDALVMEGIPRFYFDDFIHRNFFRDKAALSMGNLKKVYADQTQDQAWILEQRVKRLDEVNTQLVAEGLPTMGKYHEYLVQNYFEIEPAHIVEMRFRTELMSHGSPYKIPLRLLARVVGRELAVARMRAKLIVDDAGHILGFTADAEAEEDDLSEPDDFAPAESE